MVENNHLKLIRYQVLEDLACLAGYKGLNYDIELKDGRIIALKNIKIERVELKEKGGQ